MNSALIAAVDEINQAKHIAYGLRGLMVEFDTSRTCPTSEEAAALAALAQAIGERCERAVEFIGRADR